MSQSNMGPPSSGLKFVGEELRNGLNYARKVDSETSG
jgi:hypothetical protein